MNRAEFEQKIMEYNLITFYDGNIYPPFDDGWRTYTKANEYVNEAGLYGVYKDTDGKWIYYITEYNDRGPQMRYHKQCDTEHEAFEQLFKKVMRFKATTNRKRAEKQVLKFIKCINQKKIQRNCTTKQEDIDITLEHLDQIISNIWGENYTYTFTNNIDIIEKQSHEPILSVYCYTPYDSLKKQNNYDIMIPFMHRFDELYFVNGKELANDFVTHYVDTNAIYFMYYRDIIKTDFKGKKIWQKHFAYNKENDIYLHTHIFLSTWSWNNEQYPSDEYICITNGFNSYLVNKEDGEMNRI